MRDARHLLAALAVAWLVCAGTVAAAAAASDAASTAFLQPHLVDRLDDARAGEGIEAGATELMEVSVESTQAAPAAPAPAPRPHTSAPPTPGAPSASGPAAAASSAAAAPSAVKLTASTSDDVAKWAEHKARNRKKYATPEKEAAAFERFKVNRRVIAARNAKAASKQNPKPFSSKGALATKTPAQFKAMLKTKAPPLKSGSGKTVGKSGARVGKSGRRAGKSGARAGKSGARAGKSGRRAGKSGARAGKSGLRAGKSGRRSGKSGARSGKSGARAADAQGLIVNQGAQQAEDMLQGFTGVIYQNKADTNPGERLCRVVVTMWIARYVDGPQKAAGLKSADFYQREAREMCLIAGERPEEARLQQAWDTLWAASHKQPFLNRVVSLDVVPRDQELCGSCFAQTAIGSYEVALRKTGMKPPPLSVQQILDCARTEESRGCAGGTPMDALKWMSQNFVATEAEYPYTGVDGQCRLVASGPPKAQGWEMAVPACASGDCAKQFAYETDLLFKVQRDGPFVAYVDATNWQYYDKGLFPPSECSGHSDAGNHVVELMGYAQDEGTPYWIIKNSWGPTWGENGYIRLPMGINACGIANYVGQAVLAVSMPAPNVAAAA